MVTQGQTGSPRPGVWRCPVPKPVPRVELLTVFEYRREQRLCARVINVRDRTSAHRASELVDAV